MTPPASPSSHGALPPQNTSRSLPQKIRRFSLPAAAFPLLLPASAAFSLYLNNSSMPNPAPASPPPATTDMLDPGHFDQPKALDAGSPGLLKKVLHSFTA
jgi:hypothetical protein